MKTNKTAKCILEDNNRKYEITAEITEGGELFFRHVMTNQLCNSVYQTLDGWSEQEDIDNENWKYLVDCIADDDILDQKIFDEMEEIEYYK